MKLCAAILIDGSIKGSTIRSNDHYSLYFEERYGLMNVSTLHRWLYEQGYLRTANLPEALSLYKVPELKMILESLGLKKTGKKYDLIDRIINALDDVEKERIVNQCEYLFVTERGYDFLEENGDYDIWHRKSYGVTFEEFNKHRILQGRKRKFHGVKKEQEYIKSLHETFSQGTLDRLIELKDYYEERILDIVYDLQILPYCIFGKTDMADAIHDLYEGTFDEDFYTNYICINYGKYIKKFL